MNLVSQFFTMIVFVLTYSINQVDWPLHVNGTLWGYKAEGDLVLAMDKDAIENKEPPRGAFTLTGTLETAATKSPMFLSGEFTLVPPAAKAKIYSKQVTSSLDCWTERAKDDFYIRCATPLSGIIFETKYDLKPALGLLPHPDQPITDQLWLEASTAPEP